jgi:hypothetical protein
MGLSKCLFFSSREKVLQIREEYLEELRRLKQRFPEGSIVCSCLSQCVAFVCLDRMKRAREQSDRASYAQHLEELRCPARVSFREEYVLECLENALILDLEDKEWSGEDVLTIIGEMDDLKCRADRERLLQSGDEMSLKMFDILTRGKYS